MLKHAGNRLLRPLAHRTALARRCAPRQAVLPRSFLDQTSRSTTRWFASVHEVDANASRNSDDPEETPDDGERQSQGPPRPIREQLRNFVKTELPLGAMPMPRDYVRIGSTENTMTRNENQSMVELEGASDVVDEDDVFALGSGSSDGDIPTLGRPYGAVRPQAGDLVEVTTDSWRVQLLAVCLGSFRGVDHFYTNTGKWFVSSRVASLFSVTNFATAEEMAPVIAALPAAAVTEGYDEAFKARKDLASGQTAGPSSGDNEAAAGGGEDGEDDTDVMDLDSMLDTLKDLKLGPSRAAGAGLIRKMNTFAEQSAAIHMSHSAALDNAFDLIQGQWDDETSASSSPSASHPLRGRPYATIHEIAAFLLRKSGHKINQVVHRSHTTGYGRSPPIRILRNGFDAAASDEFTPEALYAVYRAVKANDIAFRPLSALDSRNDTVEAESRKSAEEEGIQPVSRTRSCLYSILPAADMEVIRNVESTARVFYAEAPAEELSYKLAGKKKEVDLFLAKARRAIDRSRQTRDWLPYGMLGPLKASSSAGGSESKNGHETTRQNQAATLHEQWSEQDVQILRFMHLWASFQRFSPGSRLHWVGAAVLRATERYKESEYLTMNTGWTFLQEVGWVSPWDLPSRYSMSLPDVLPLRTGGLVRPLLPEPSGSGPSGPSGPPKPHKPSAKPALTPVASSASLLAKDVFEGVRKNWGDMPVFCIDAPGATDIDDGVSLAETDHPDEFWIHVHVADPASRIPPGSPLAEQASRMPQTAYLPGFFARMFPDDVVREQFSLAAGRPCLTFSAKVNREGTVLASEITPATIQRVVFISPDEVSTIIDEVESSTIRTLSNNSGDKGSYLAIASAPPKLDLPSRVTSFSVGDAPLEPIREDDVQPTAAPDTTNKSSTAAERTMSTAADLSDQERTKLKEMAALATALRAVRLSNGAMPLYWPLPNVQVSLANTTVTPWTIPDEAADSAPTSLDQPSHTFVQCTGDPYIRIWYDQIDDGPAGTDGTSPADSGAGSRLVESTMRLAGEVAADWCHAQDIPVPFRGQPDAAPYRARLETLTRDSIYPALATGHRPPEPALREMRRLLGADDVTAVAVPHVTMGVERYTKATSPLRRYSDLVVHWQIEARLRERLDDTAAPVPLPFTRDRMEADVLPQLRMRERALRALDRRSGRDQWMLQALVRGWQADPATFEQLKFTVTRVVPRLGLITGRLDWFERVAVLESSGLLGYRNESDDGASAPPLPTLHFEDVRPGQVLMVALQHVDVHGNRVLVRRVE